MTKLKYPTRPQFIQDVKFKDYQDAKLYLTRFATANVPVLFIGNEHTQEVYAICNINPEIKLNEFEFVIKDYSENEGMLDWLIENNLMKNMYAYYLGGFVQMPICHATEELKQKIIFICSDWAVFVGKADAVSFEEGGEVDG